MAGYFGIGKDTVIKMLKACNSIKLLGDMTACMKEVVKEATRFVSACYGMTDTERLLRYKTFGQPW